MVIRDAILRLDPSCAVFTSSHLLLVQLCLHARAYACAVPVLEKHIFHIPGSNNINSSNHTSILCAEHESSLAYINNVTGLSSKLSCNDYLRYFLYGAMVYMALKEWHKAFHFLGTVISMPTTSSVSLVMVEAYKKWILVGLLSKGKVSWWSRSTGIFIFILANNHLLVTVMPAAKYSSPLCHQDISVSC